MSITSQVLTLRRTPESTSVSWLSLAWRLTTYRHVTPRFLLSIHNLAMINDHGIPGRSVSHIPANALTEFRLGVTEKEDIRRS